MNILSKKNLSFVENFSASNEDQLSVFRRLSTEIAELAATVNIKVLPFRNESLEHFSKLNHDTRKNILNSLEIYLSVHQAVQAEGSSLLDSVRVIWNALVKLGYRPTSDLFSYIKEGHVVEIHDNQAVQMFRNLIFFNYCSYSLEELYCFKMPELYSRDMAVEESLMSCIQTIFSGTINSVVRMMDLKPHIITESTSYGRLQIRDQIHYLAPLFPVDGGDIALISIESAEIHSCTLNSDHKSEEHGQKELVNSNVFELKRPAAVLEEDPSL